MVRSLVKRCRQSQKFSIRDPVSRTNFDDFRRAEGQRAGLVEHSHAHAAERLKNIASFYQDPSFCGTGET